jgi:glucose-6-phosphate-specific signal transduction histidine kinase
VELAFSPSALDVRVTNPLGSDRAVRESGGGHGIVGMRERAALLGGTLEAGPREGRFELRARLPARGGGA